MTINQLVTLQWDSNDREIDWKKDPQSIASRKQSGGWRIPTIEELEKAFLDKVKGFCKADYLSNRSSTDLTLVSMNDGKTKVVERFDGFPRVRLVRWA